MSYIQAETLKLCVFLNHISICNIKNGQFSNMSNRIIRFTFSVFSSYAKRWLYEWIIAIENYWEISSNTTSGKIILLSLLTRMLVRATRTRKIINISKWVFISFARLLHTGDRVRRPPLVNSGSVKSINLVVVTPPRHFLLFVRVDLQLSLSNGLVLTSEDDQPDDLREWNASAVCAFIDRARLME